MVEEARKDMRADSLLAVVQAVPMRCADCGMATTQDLPCPASAAHTFVTDDAAIVRAVRAWLRGIGCRCEKTQ